MSTSVAAPASTPGPVTPSSQPIVSSETSPPILRTKAIGPDKNKFEDQFEDQVGHMWRRLFRTLERPDHPILAIQCDAVSLEELRATTDQFLSDATVRDSQNLVLAVPTDDDFTKSEAFDVIQSVKHAAFENGFDGKVSWLLIQEPAVELAALRALVDRQGGHWYAND